MSEELNDFFCAILGEAEERASKTQNPIDNIVVKFLKSVCKCS
jgi:hypothetical protein